MLRQWFAQWGLPAQLRLDNGPPWGGSHDLPPDLALWLLGLGLALVWNQPRHKQGNAVIERDHGVCQRWVEAATCPDLATLQARLDWATTTQRERYPSCHGQSRLAASPGLVHSGRSYDPAQETETWDVERVWHWLGEQVWTRRVDKVGRISLANRPLGVGRAWAGQEVSVRLVVPDGAPVWAISDVQGQRLRQHPAPELGRERIVALDVARRRVRPPRPVQPRARHGVNPYAR